MAQQVLGRVVGSRIYSGNGTTNSAIASDLTSKGITPLIYDLYISNGNTSVFQYQLVETTPTWVLLMNIKGEPGTFAISKVYASVSAMNAGYATDNVPIGGLVVIDTGDVEDPDNAKLYVKGSSAYEYLTDMSGASGIQGPQGETGATGPQGEQGIQGPAGADGKTPTLSINANGELVATYAD